MGQTYAFTLDSDPTRIVCAFTVSNDALQIKGLSNRSRRRVNQQIPHAKSYSAYPAMKIGRLGIDKSFQGQGIGRQLMDFIKAWFCEDANKTGCRFITVDAYNNEKALNYYLKNEFEFLFMEEQNELDHFNLSRSSPIEGPINTRIMYFDLIKLKSK